MENAAASLQSKITDKLYLNHRVPAWEAVLNHSKTQKTKDVINLRFLQITLEVESPEAPYPTTLAEVKPYWNYVLRVFVKEPELQQLNEKIRSVVKAIMVGMLGKVFINPDPEDVVATSLKSMIDAVGQKNTIDFISIIEFNTTKQLVADLDSECPGLVDRLLSERD